VHKAVKKHYWDILVAAEVMDTTAGLYTVENYVEVAALEHDIRDCFVQTDVSRHALVVGTMGVCYVKGLADTDQCN